MLEPQRVDLLDMGELVLDRDSGTNRVRTSPGGTKEVSSALQSLCEYSISQTLGWEKAFEMRQGQAAKRRHCC